jgi:hypothetical protein
MIIPLTTNVPTAPGKYLVAIVSSEGSSLAVVRLTSRSELYNCGAYWGKLSEFVAIQKTKWSERIEVGT